MITLEDAIIMFKEKEKSAIWKSNNVCMLTEKKAYASKSEDFRQIAEWLEAYNKLKEDRTLYTVDVSIKDTDEFKAVLKALELACHRISGMIDCEFCDMECDGRNCYETLVNYYLKKAR